MFLKHLIILIIIGFERGVFAVEDPKLIFFYGKSIDSNKTYELTESVQILRHPKFHRHFETVLYIHGYVESPASPTVQLVVNAYIKRRSHNILVLDWSKLVNGSYFTAVNNSIEVGPKISIALINLFNSGMNHHSLHLVGHSLGGQLSGIIGRSIIQLSKKKLRRISALDPALPLFYPPSNVTVPISAHDAVLVDIIHTDAGKYGSPVNTGCVDFVVNGGTRFQPGCPVGTFPALNPNDTCSHQRSVALWAESVSNLRPTFLATRSEVPIFKINMGIDCPITASRFPGIFMVETNAQPPYSLSSRRFF